ncbi:MAG: copper amine oxidase N-terminal domain-containing protein [Armatimonadetes bacterium]|nr:copper amine oxidase N-terminal domain-containing protein [Armatimonadota bacterium]
MTLATAADIQVYVDGSPVNFEYGKPMKVHDRVVVPLRGVFERLGATVDWNSADSSILCHKGTKEVWLRIGDRQARIDSQNVMLDQPAILYREVTMVPLRFVSEALGADVSWNEALQAVNISTVGAGTWNNSNTGSTGTSANTHAYMDVVLEPGTVIPLILETQLNSKTALKGDRFTARLDTNGMSDYQGLPVGTTVMGHVTEVKAKTDKDPGVIDLGYDAVVLPDGRRYLIDGSTVSLDNKSVENRNGRLVAKGKSADGNLKSVWVGAGAGAVLGILTKTNVLTTTVVGAALGYLYDRLNINGDGTRDVQLDEGQKFGLRIDRDFVAKIDK